MRHNLVFLFLLVLFWGMAQKTSTNQVDHALFKAKIEQLSRIKGNSLGDSLIYIGKSFLGIPYVEKTLELGQSESLVINLRGLDCTTYVENTLALGLLLQEGQNDFNSFAQNLKTIRYRNGKIAGYPSRLHYFTEWIRDNQKKGLIRDITGELGGISHNKPINFMGTHRNLYPFLKSDENFERILEMEAKVAQEPLCYLPQDEIAKQEQNIQSGDIIALATAIKGLDVTHTGFAIRMPTGRIHLLHASSSGSVQITKEPLEVYLKKIKNNIGIMVARPIL